MQRCSATELLTSYSHSPPRLCDLFVAVASKWLGPVDDASSRAIYSAVDLGATFFDTANVYGAGHSE